MKEKRMIHSLTHILVHNTPSAVYLAMIVQRYKGRLSTKHGIFEGVDDDFLVPLIEDEGKQIRPQDDKHYQAEETDGLQMESNMKFET